jgi:hypothetical protein
MEESKMKTESTISILELANGDKICKYCGRKIKVTHETSRNSNYWGDEWDEYECDCED